MSDYVAVWVLWFVLRGITTLVAIALFEWALYITLWQSSVVAVAVALAGPIPTPGASK